MKKTLYLCVFIATTLAFTSCSSDDDSPAQDQIIGKWKVLQELENGVEQELGCDSQEGITEFKADRTFTYEEYSISNTTGQCVYTETYAGIWENVGSGKYGFTEDGETFTDTVEFVGETLIITYIEDGDIYKTIFQRQ